MRGGRRRADLEDLEAGERARKAGAPRHLHAAPVEDLYAPGLAVDLDGEVSSEVVRKAAAAQSSAAGGESRRIWRETRGREPASDWIARRA
jgi:hypothetical protein